MMGERVGEFLKHRDTALQFTITDSLDLPGPQDSSHHQDDIF